MLYSETELCWPKFWLSTEIPGPARCKGSGEGKAAASVAPRSRLGWASRRLACQPEVQGSFWWPFQESRSLPQSSSVMALMTEVLRQWSISRTPLILLDRILTYSFGVGQGLTAGISYWFGLRAWEYLIYMWEGPHPARVPLPILNLPVTTFIRCVQNLFPRWTYILSSWQWRLTTTMNFLKEEKDKSDFIT